MFSLEGVCRQVVLPPGDFRLSPSEEPGCLPSMRFAMTLASPDRTGATRMACAYCRALGHQVRLIHGPVPAQSILGSMKGVGVDLALEAGLARPLGAVAQRVARLAGDWGARALIGVNQRDRAVALTAAHRLRIPGVLMLQSLHHFWGGWPIAAIKRFYYTRVMRASEAERER